MRPALDVSRLSVPIVQAGMGSISRFELAAAVADAGGLGTLAGTRAPIDADLAAARALTAGPIAVNLLLPFLRRDDARAAAGADAIVTFWGAPRRLAGCTWIHQCGSVAEAKAAAHAGADAVIAQGVQAGGHVRGSTPTLELVQQVRAAVSIPVLAAGGIVDRDGVQAALEAGAVAAVVGTRFLLSEESRAHPEYKQRCLQAESTVLTELFGLSWPSAPHRVIPNAATRRWLHADGSTPAWIRATHRLAGPLAARLPPRAQARALAAQRPVSPLLSPQPPTIGGPAALLDAGPLYAGANVAQIREIAPAARLVAALTP
jgi:nitronate monooxygenase